MFTTDHPSQGGMTILPIISKVAAVIPPALKAILYRWLAIGATMVCDWLIGVIFGSEESPVPPKPPKPPRALPPNPK